MKVTLSFNNKPCTMFHNEFHCSFLDTNLYIAFKNLKFIISNRFSIPKRIAKLVTNLGNFKFIELIRRRITSSSFLLVINYLKFPLRNLNDITNNLLTFDDAIIQQIEVIKAYSKNKENKIIVFPSGMTLREHDNIKLIDNELAHIKFHQDFKPPYPSTFMSSIEVWDLLDSNVKVGIHGWYHLYIGDDKENHSGNLTNALRILYNEDYKISSVLKLLKYDSEKIMDWYIDNLKKNDNYKMFIEDNVIKLYYCTPYNVRSYYQDIYIQFLIERIKKNEFLLSLNYDIHLEVFSNERKQPNQNQK